MMTNSDITIYNKYYDSPQDKEVYQRTEIKGVHFEENKAVKLQNQGLVSDDKVLICIPFSAKCSREYARPMLFDKLDDKTPYFTLKEGDRIVRGIQTYEVERQKELDERFETFTITNVDTCDYGRLSMQHWEVGCK